MGVRVNNWDLAERSLHCILARMVPLNARRQHYSGRPGPLQRELLDAGGPYPLAPGLLLFQPREERSARRRKIPRVNNSRCGVFRAGPGSGAIGRPSPTCASLRREGPPGRTQARFCLPRGSAPPSSLWVPFMGRLDRRKHLQVPSDIAGSGGVPRLAVAWETEARSVPYFHAWSVNTEGPRPQAVAQGRRGRPGARDRRCCLLPPGKTHSPNPHLFSLLREFEGAVVLLFPLGYHDCR